MHDPSMWRIVVKADTPKKIDFDYISKFLELRCDKRSILVLIIVVECIAADLSPKG